jgi:hypothetical protein
VTVPGAEPAFCARPDGNTASDVWAHDGGVYVLTTTSCEILAGEFCAGDAESILKVNHGGGWETIESFRQTENRHLSGIPGLGAVVGGLPDCSVSLYDEMADTLGLTCPETWQGSWSSPGLWSMNGDFVVVGGNGDLRRLEDADSAETLDLPNGALAGNGSLIVSVTSGVLTRAPLGEDSNTVPNFPVGTYHSAWVTDANVVYTGNQVGQIVRVEGDDITTLNVGGPRETMRHLWGAGEEVFFAKDKAFGRIVDGSDVEVLFELDDESDQEFAGLSGISASEVFLAVRDGRFQSDPCGQEFLLWYDGTELRSF